MSARAVSAVAVLFAPTVLVAGLVRAASVAAGLLIHRAQERGTTAGTTG
ncbi:hypothetical protein AB0C52_19370 [Streptomyces sp. NPDC048717]